MSANNEYRVLLFGDVKATAGTSAVIIPAPTLLTARQLLQQLAHGGGSHALLMPDGVTPFVAPPCWGDVVRPTILAVNLEYISATALDTIVPATAEVALIPPISGG